MLHSNYYSAHELHQFEQTLAEDHENLLEFLCNKIGFWPESEEDRNEIIDHVYVNTLGVVEKDKFGQYDPSTYLCLTHSMTNEELNECVA